MKIHILCSVTFICKSCRLWDNVEKCTAGQATDNNVIRRMRIACWVTIASYTDSESVILIAFPWQQWSHERAAVLRLYIHCLCWVLLRACQSKHDRYCELGPCTTMREPANEGDPMYYVLQWYYHSHKVWGGIAPCLMAERLRLSIGQVFLLCHCLCTGSEILMFRV
jgi:hypothetical protein